jgi:hypothetical protein
LNGFDPHFDLEQEFEDDLEVVDYRYSDESRPESPGPDQLPRLPSPSNDSSLSQQSQDPRELPVIEDETQTVASQPEAVAPVGRHTLAQRLARIARQLATTPEEDLPLDQLVLTEQVNQLELSLLGISLPKGGEGPEETSPQTPTHVDTTMAIRTRPSAKSQRAPPVYEAVAETAAQLSKDLETLHGNLRARHEEATHIHVLLLSRLELAAQRILVLQRKAEDLESQLRESDDELGHLRVLLKALEIQVPEHPDEDLRRCLVRVRQEFWAVRKRREALHRKNMEDEIG